MMMMMCQSIASTRVNSYGLKLILFQFYKLPLSSDTITPWSNSVKTPHKAAGKKHLPLLVNVCQCFLCLWQGKLEQNRPKTIIQPTLIHDCITCGMASLVAKRGNRLSFQVLNPCRFSAKISGLGLRWRHRLALWTGWPSIENDVTAIWVKEWITRPRRQRRVGERWMNPCARCVIDIFLILIFLMCHMGPRWRGEEGRYWLSLNGRKRSKEQQRRYDDASFML